jgi:HD-like signal output (HDOD) protein
MSKRILFVDDDPAVLEGLQDILFLRQTEWDMTFAGSGQAALEHLTHRTFDVIVSDIQMPGMDGITLLERIQRQHPAMVRIFLSGQPEAEVGLRVAPVCHQFLSKPCDADTLVNTVNRTCRLRDLVSNESLRKVVGGISRLPAFPALYMELQKLIAGGNADPVEIARIVKQDISMSAKVLQIVNSAYFGLGRRISSVEQAVIYMGALTVQQMVLASVFSGIVLPPGCGVQMEHLRRHSLLTAAIARNMFILNPDKAPQAWTAGMLHDLGKVVLAWNLPHHLPPAFELAEKTSCSLFRAERELYGVTHAEVGAYLLGLWGLPGEIVEAVANHHRPEEVQPSGLDLVVSIYTANALAHECANPAPAAPAAGNREINLELLASLNLAKPLEGWRLYATKIAPVEASQRQ